MDNAFDNYDLYKHCELCPRRCGVDRTSGGRGVCRMDSELYAARAALHMWEEPCISGERGSGAVFFTGCSLRCVYCQNIEISRGEHGRPVTVRGLADIFLRLQNACHANNINLVTACHYIPHVAAALRAAKADGLKIPVVYNSSGYESTSSLRLLSGLVDVYLPDFKYVSSALSASFSGAPDYYDVAVAALDEMLYEVGEPQFAASDDFCGCEEGIMKRGVIVRHLCLPGHTDDSREVIYRLHERYGDKIYISIMNQYTPNGKTDVTELNRTLTDAEYDSVVDYACDIGVENGFIQEGGTVGESFIPPFDFTGIL